MPVSCPISMHMSRFKVLLCISVVLCIFLATLVYQTVILPKERWSHSAFVGMFSSAQREKLVACKDCNFPESTFLMDFRPSNVQYVHQSWKTSKLPSRFRRWASTWKKCFPKARHILWTDADNRDFIMKHYPWFLQRYDNLPSNICRADAVRYLYLFHYGGIYTDLDNECLHPFDHLLLNATIVLGSMVGYNNVVEGFVQNSFMYSSPRHPLWIELVLQIMAAKQFNVPTETLTGPGALVNAINEYRKRMNSTADITVYPPQFFNPFSWQKNKVKACKDFNLMSNAEMVACRNAFINTSYVVQYHTHTWGGGKIL